MAAGYFENADRIKDLVSLSAELFKRAQDAVAQRVVPTPKVAPWLRAPRQRLLLTVVTFLLLMSVVKIVLLAVAIARHDDHILTLVVSHKWIFVIELGLLFLICTYVSRKGARPESLIDNQAISRGFSSENRFFSYWPYLWASWFVLYALLGANTFVTISSPYFSVAANFLNNLSGLFIFGMLF
jgi:hypothetical protein